jgi:y4mF family transcriptional regulator
MANPIQILSLAEIGQVIRERRKQLGLKQADAAGLVGVGVRFLSELERGKDTLEFGKVLQVLTGLGFSLALHPTFESVP